MAEFAHAEARFCRRSLLEVKLAHLRLTHPTATGGSPSPSWDDRALINALLQGDRRAAAVLYDHVRPAIDQALRRVLRHRSRDFEDLTQTTFERMLRALAEDRFEGRSALKTWAAAIAGHVALDALRSVVREEGRHAQALEVEDLPSQGRADNHVEALAELRRVHGVLARMKANLAETLVLHDVLGHSLDEIAAIRGASVTATQSRLHRARIELRRRLGAVQARTGS